MMADNQHPSVKALVAQFRRLSDPTSDPDAALRAKLRAFQRDYLDAKGSEGGHVSEGETRLLEAAGSWPVSPTRLREVWREVWGDPEELPSLSPPAQLVWLGTETQCPNEITAAALLHQFPALDREARAAVGREVVDFFTREARQYSIEAAIFRAWHDFHTARGRAEGELLFGNCCEELGLVEEREEGRYLNFNNLKNVADAELRHATLAAAWKAGEERGVGGAAQGQDA